MSQDPSPSPTPAKKNAPRRPSRFRRWLKTLLVLVILGSIGAIAYPKFRDLTSSDDQPTGALTHTVRAERLLITVNEDGNLESASNVDVRCRIAGSGTTILWIVEDGKQVQAGEEIVRLDTAAIEEQLNAQKIVYERALSTKTQAEADVAAANIALKEYAQGTVIKELQDAEALITIALENLRSAENLLKHTERMVRKGFATPQQLETDKFSVKRAKLELASAETAKMVLETFTKAKTIKGLEAVRDAADAHKRAEQAAFDLEKVRLERLQEQLQYGVITAPQSGMIVYANSTSRRSTEVQIEEGAMVREQQVIVRIPDLSTMQAKVTVHETKVDQLSPGMLATVTIQGRKLEGEVISVANQPEPGSWMSGNVKTYAAVVKINGESAGLKPGMTAQVEILVDDLVDVLTVPVVAVVEQRGNFFAWVDTPQGPQRRPLVLGATNDKVIEVKDGLKLGDKVLLNPRAYVPEAREEGSGSKKDGEKGKRSGGKPRGKKKPGGKKPSSPDNGGGPRKPSGEGSPGGGLARFDTDGDGKISKTEAPERMKAAFDRLDGNSDGFIDQAEQVAAAAMRKNRENSETGEEGRPTGEGGGAN